jgi:hypothetical protein
MSGSVLGSRSRVGMVSLSTGMGSLPCSWCWHVATFA